MGIKGNTRDPQGDEAVLDLDCDSTYKGPTQVIQLLRTNIHAHTEAHTDEFKLKWGRLNEPDGLYQY